VTTEKQNMQINHQQLLNRSIIPNANQARTRSRSFTGRTLRLVLTAATILVNVAGAQAGWSFAILGDTRGNDDGQDAGVSPYLNAIARKIASLPAPKPAFVLVNGDLISGELIGGTYANFVGQFNTWKTAMNPVVAANIPIYPVRGNHENEIVDAFPPTAPLKQAYYDCFGENMPTNGPNNGPDDDQRGFSYSFVHRNLTVVAADQYFYYNQYINLSPQNLGYHSLDQQWVVQQLQTTDTPYKLVMVHEPSFITTGQDLGEQYFGTESDGLERRAEFWNAMGNNGCRLYVCGHVHGLSVASVADEAGNKLYQMMTGNGGAAPLDSLHPEHEAGVDVLYTNGLNFGFALATVGDEAMTIEYYLLNTNHHSWSKTAYTTTIPAVPKFAGGVGAEWLIVDHPNAVGTVPRGVSGDKIVGYYYPTASEEHGFAYDGTTWSDLDYPGALFTQPLGISGKKIVGDYTTDPNGVYWHAFVYDGKAWKTLDFPGAVATHAFGIEGNKIVGYYFTGHADHGFVFDGKTWTTLDYPGAVGSFVNGVSHGAMAGTFVDGDFRGFLYDGSGWMPLDAPGASVTHCWGISGDLVAGRFWNGPPGEHGFLYDRADATWSKLDFPGADATDPFGIDDRSIVGTFKVGEVTHGFLCSLAPDRSGHSARAEGWVIGTFPADGYGVILHTTNGGYQWERQGSASAIPNVWLNNVKAVDRHTVWVVGNSDSRYGLILRTDDGGQTWARQGQPGMIPDVALCGVGAADRKTAWVVGSQGTILRTADGGRTWTQQTSGTTVTLREVAVISSNIAWAVGEVDSGYPVVLHTTNGGRTWVRQGTAATLGADPFIDFTAVSPRTAWAVGGNSQVAKTSDGGATWQTQMGPGLPHNNGVCAVNPNTVWMATDYDMVYRTTNGGTTWDKQELAGRILGDYYMLGVSALDRETAWVVGGAVFPPDKGIILHTTDGGDTWQIQQTPVNVTFRRASFLGLPK